MLLIYVSLLFLPSLIQGAINRVNAQLVNTLTSNIVITPAARRPASATMALPGQDPPGRRGRAATAVYHVGTQVSYGANSGSWTVDAIDPASYGAVFTTPSEHHRGPRASPPPTPARCCSGSASPARARPGPRLPRLTADRACRGQGQHHPDQRPEHELHRRRDLRQPVPAVRQQRLPHHDRGAEAAAGQPRPRHGHLCPHPPRDQHQPGGHPAQRAAQRREVPDLRGAGHRSSRTRRPPSG